MLELGDEGLKVTHAEPVLKMHGQRLPNEVSGLHPADSGGDPDGKGESIVIGLDCSALASPTFSVPWFHVRPKRK